MSAKQVIQFKSEIKQDEQNQTSLINFHQIQKSQMNSIKYSSPIHNIANFSTNKQNHSNHSEDIMEDLANSFNKINDKNQDNDDIIVDFMGNKVQNFTCEEQQQQQLSPISEDKENINPLEHLQTPLKIRETKVIRSPLGDITPSMTQRKKKYPNTLTIGEKHHYMTPRTMAKSRLNNSSGLRKIQRF